MPKEVALYIFVFWILAPTVDQGFDIAIIVMLFKGPGADLPVRGGKAMTINKTYGPGTVLKLSILKSYSFPSRRDIMEPLEVRHQESSMPIKW